jgi:beta-glucosidase
MDGVRLKELLHSLTLKEKIYQLVQLSGDFYNAGSMAVGPQQKLGITQEVVDNAGSILNVLGAEKVKKIQDDYLAKSRHKIPLLFMADIIYGYRTIYPIPLGLGCTWNPDLVKQLSEKTAEESSAAGAHVTFAPMVDLVRDARWGRCLESTGEDTYLNSLYAKAMVEGFQGDFSKGKSIASCVKHFAGYGAAEAGREYNTVDMSERRLRQDYLPAYKAAVDAGCEMVMTSFNTIDEIPATANKWLMKDILRDEWGFDGVIITDYAAIQELIAHGVAGDDREATKLAIEATVDIDMKTPCYSNQLEPLIKEGEISEQLIDEAVWRILKLKNKLGLFEDPYRGASEEREQQLLCSNENRALARETAAKAAVLLKNDNGILPIHPNKKKVALIGPYGDSQDLIGLWAVHGKREDVVTLKTALEEKLDQDHLLYAKGCETLDDYSFLGEFGTMINKRSVTITDEEREAELQHAVEVARQSDVVILALGEHMMQSGEAGSRTNLTLPDVQLELLEKIKECNKPIILVLFNGRPLVLTDVEPKVDAILEAWFPGTEGGHALADILLGEVNPTGKLTMSFPYAVGQIPIYYNEFNTGRPAKTSTHSSRFVSKFLDCPNDPLYPFGYGLSYTTFEYSNLQLDKDTFADEETINVSVDVVNTGERTGEETVQLYVRDLVGSVVRPVKELKDFAKVTLAPGERKTVTFVIDKEKLEFFTRDMSYQAEPGEFLVFAGKNSVEVLESEFTYLTSKQTIVTAQ